jgi:hypothetical protein
MNDLTVPFLKFETASPYNSRFSRVDGIIDLCHHTGLPTTLSFSFALLFFTSPFSSPKVILLKLMSHYVLEQKLPSGQSLYAEERADTFNLVAYCQL